MGASVLNRLTQIRTDVKDALTGAGVKAIDFVEEAFTTPVCVVVPDAPYITLPVGENPYREPYSVRLQVLVVGSKGTNKTAATQIDSMLVDVLDALDDWDITEVTAPGEISLKGVSHMAAVVTLEQNTSLEKEVI